MKNGSKSVEYFSIKFTGKLKIAWVKWETVCLPKQNGGLGIKDIRTFNKALLGKWRWDLFHQHKELWARILASKYGGWRSLVDAKRVSNESVWWQDLLVVTHDQQFNNILQEGTIWRVGCGTKSVYGRTAGLAVGNH